MKATPEMIAAGASAARKYMEETGGNSLAVIWDAMWKAQPEQEPVAHIPSKALEQIKPPMLVLNNVPLYGYSAEGTTAVYTTPPQRKPLTDEQINTIMYSMLNDWDWREFARAIEAKIKEKNVVA